MTGEEIKVNDTVNIVFIADNNYVIPTITAIYSIVRNKTSSTRLNIYILTDDMDSDHAAIFHRVEKNEMVHISVISASARKYETLHHIDKDSPCVASIAALLKFDIPNVLNDIDKVLYLDGDLVVRGDLLSLYNTNINKFFLAAVVDSGSIYYKHQYVKKVSNYFNSGVMLMNLAKMREVDATTLLIDEKQNSKDSFLMDQNIFNVVFDKQICLLPIRYNFLYVNLVRAKEKYSIKDINQRYGTNYTSLDDAVEDAMIIHYSSKDKPWKSNDIPLGEEWNFYFREATNAYQLPRIDNDFIEKNENACPKVSVIIPVYNTERYLRETLFAIANQTLREIEIICINDGSSDGSQEILEAFSKNDNRIRLFSQSNKGQSAARNVGIQAATGEYIYFFDSDDLLKPHSLEELYTRAKKDSLDILLFDGESFYETPQLEREFAQYKTYYMRSQKYPRICSGEELYVDMVSHGDYRVSPCLQFFSREYINRKSLRYYEGIIYEDNLFALQAILQARRASHTSSVLFRRRVRKGSTMTKAISFRNFRSHFICLQEMYLFIIENHFSDAAVETARRQFNQFFRVTCTFYQALSPNDKRRPWCQAGKKQMLSEILYQCILLNCTDSDEFAMRELRAIHSSWTYRIGRFITFIPRKVRGGIRCCKEHGLRYTWNLLLAKLHIKK